MVYRITVVGNPSYKWLTRIRQNFGEPYDVTIIPPAWQPPQNEQQPQAQQEQQHEDEQQDNQQQEEEPNITVVAQK